MLRRDQFARTATRFHLDDKGGLTIFGLYLFIVTCFVGAIALDYSNLIHNRTRLQVAGDAAAHAALAYRLGLLDDMTKHDAAASKLKGIEAAEKNIPPSMYGTVLRPENISFGYYDQSTQTFTKDDASEEAVWVEADRDAITGNAVSSFLFHFVGFDAFNVHTASVFARYMPCAGEEGYFAEGVVDMQSNNHFMPGFCIHSNTHVEVNQGNFYETGVTITMPDLADFVMPNSGYTQNTGLEAALGEAYYPIKILTRLDKIWDGMTDPDSQFFRDYITSVNGVVTTNNLNDILTTNKVLTADVAEKMENKVWKVSCTGGAAFKIDGGVTVKNAVLMSDNCKFQFEEGSAFEDSVLLTKSDDAQSIKAPNGFRLGSDDGCNDGGGAQIITWGGVSIAADLQVYGGQIIAKGDIAFAAQADGLGGAAFIAGGKIDGTSLTEMSYCGTGMLDGFFVDYIRLAG